MNARWTFDVSFDDPFMELKAEVKAAISQDPMVIYIAYWKSHYKPVMFLAHPSAGIAKSPQAAREAYSLAPRVPT